MRTQRGSSSSVQVFHCSLLLSLFLLSFLNYNISFMFSVYLVNIPHYCCTAEVIRIFAGFFIFSQTPLNKNLNMWMFKYSPIQ